MNKTIVFVGGIGRPEQFGGELSKNKEIIRRMTGMGYSLICIDTHGANHNAAKLLSVVVRFFWLIVRRPKATFLLSTAFNNIYPFLRVLSGCGIRRRVVYWGIGGLFASRILKGEIRKSSLDIIDLFLVEGEKMRRQLADAGYANARVVPNFKTVGTVVNADIPQQGTKRFVFLSRILPEKGCDYILDSVAALNDEGLEQDFTVDFYGNVGSSYQTEFDARRKRLPNVHYCGTLDLRQEQNYERLGEYNFMLFPTYWHGEGFPGIVIDAYKAGIPLIASDWNLNPEFVEQGKTGLIIPTHDVKALTAAMRKVIAGETDEAAMRANCRSRAALYDTQHVITPALTDIITGKKAE